MSTAFLLFAFALILCVLFRILNVNSQPQKPVFYYCDSSFLNKILKSAPILEEPYIPTRLWGFSGHVQTILYSFLGRTCCPWPVGERLFIPLLDKTTLTYDLFHPTAGSINDEDVTLIVVPGICNTSESDYIRTFVNYAQNNGYRCAVLNHVGVLPNVPVTGRRIFTYGYTADLDAMLVHLAGRYPKTKMIAFGYSMGGNLITKYLAESHYKKPENLLGAVSVCQPYDANAATDWLLHWQNFRRFYLYAMTEAIKGVVMKHRRILLADDVKQKCSLNEREIISAATLPELDDAYTRKVYNFSTLEELYRWSSCVYYLDNIKTPIIFINAKDDPLVPEPLLEPVRKFAQKRQEVVYMELEHGGHLGFFEGGLFYPNPIAWLDRVSLALVGAFLLTHKDETKVVRS
ncbi:abhydrolase domain-containing protein 2 [Bemisia tabaci]|uniref:abhydrolase domain-containing protein 2 n=1 Tax=Bemisia tabaci TaxID=7038 RepID=UPI0008F99745|nr:PREDICTED: abhydrolase domain-containing protein 2 [Bemisia tabaci]